ncbi:hypothetical protein [Sphingomonas abietis]|uniref:DUF551 domain-containing protein n=1 Tax=Sphingomonas abietis TaxID=3012344 RepID=A0ABY7NVH3_9SPHN|nr:hypothetical protein [Sphingomonas abietis]WBO23909.1 hypothetical protein PBT88_07315 [Sphingomonas abietis]
MDEIEQRARALLGDVGRFESGGSVPYDVVISAITKLLADMPTIWEDPAGKGYPCFERPMTPAECRAAIEAARAASDDWRPIETAPSDECVTIARKGQFDGWQIAMA